MEFHIKCNPEDISRYVFVPGSHSRAKLIAEHFENCRTVSETRGYLVYSGTVDGIFMTVSSTGMGGPTTAIALEELAHMGGDTFIRVGSCGTSQAYVEVGDTIIGTGTFRAGGTANNYLPIEFPAVPNYDVTMALVKAAESLKADGRLHRNFHTGLGSAGDAFYAPKNPAARELLAQSGIVSGEMESDTLFVIAALRGWRAGALYASDGNAKETKPEWGEDYFRQGERDAILIGIEGMKAIARADGV
jgi:uridine phosphorylase